MSDTPKIIQLLMSRNDNVWQGVLLGLGDDGVTYHCQGDTWQPCIPKLALEDKAIELAKVTKQRDEVTMALQNLIESLNSTNWSSWQCTSRFWKQKDAAEATLAAMKGGAA